MNNSLVSVIIPTYGRPGTLQRAIQSVYNQTYEAIEIIVVDDNNPESEERYQTEQVMQLYRAYPNILYLQHKQNRNGSAARNTGFRASHGDYIMFLDDDDEFMPDKISRQLQRLQSLDDSWAACYTAYIRKLNDKIIMYSGERREGFLLVDELGRNLFVHAGSNLMIRRHVVSEVGGFDESFDRNQDIEFLVRILKNYKLAYVDYQGLIVHITNKTKSTDFIILTEQYLEKFSSEISQLPPKNRDKVKCLIDLQKFRYFLMKRRFQNAYKVFIESKLPLYLLIKYLWYLVYRRLRKKAYGFRL